MCINVIVHVSANVEQLTTSQLRRIYSKRKLRWDNDLPIVVFVLPNQHPLHQKFSLDILHIFPYQLDRIWNKLTYSGIGTAPIVVPTPKELLNAVAHTPGAIGYVDDVDQNAAINIINISK